MDSLLLADILRGSLILYALIIVVLSKIYVKTRLRIYLSIIVVLIFYSLGIFFYYKAISANSIGVSKYFLDLSKTFFVLTSILFTPIIFKTFLKEERRIILTAYSTTIFITLFKTYGSSLIIVYSIEGIVELHGLLGSSPQILVVLLVYLTLIKIYANCFQNTIFVTRKRISATVIATLTISAVLAAITVSSTGFMKSIFLIGLNTTIVFLLLLILADPYIISTSHMGIMSVMIMNNFARPEITITIGRDGKKALEFSQKLLEKNFWEIYKSRKYLKKFKFGEINILVYQKNFITTIIAARKIDGEILRILDKFYESIITFAYLDSINENIKIEELKKYNELLKKLI